MGCYKQPSYKLKALMGVRFEGEYGTGNGPIQEFLLCAMTIPEEGIGTKEKPLIFLKVKTTINCQFTVNPFNAREHTKPSVRFCMVFPWQHGSIGV